MDGEALPATAALSASCASTAVLCIRGLRIAFGAQPVLDGVELTLAPGEWLALLGPNGAGKTTLLRAVAGLQRPQAGSICIGELSVATQTREARRVLGFGCAPEQLPKLLTGRQCLEIYAAAKGLDVPDAAVLALAEAFAMTAPLARFVDTYSSGMRQKLAVLLALLGTPRLLLLDEAFNGLDPASALTLKRYLRNGVDRGDFSVLLATHALDVVERYADRAALLLQGRLVHEWHATELQRLRGRGQGLEAAIAAVAAAHPE
jgi:ABC-2 type transport system ATP-binding protein